MVFQVKCRNVKNARDEGYTKANIKYYDSSDIDNTV